MTRDPWELLELIDDILDLRSHENLLRQFMLESSALLQHLPPDASHWLAVGTDYANGETDVDTLEAARVAAWKSIAGRDCDTTRPEVNAVRAVICVLFPNLGDYPYDHVSTFLDFSNNSENHACRQGEILDNLFSPYLDK